jgi:hypothetical protein
MGDANVELDNITDSNNNPKATSCTHLTLVDEFVCALVVAADARMHVEFFRTGVTVCDRFEHRARTAKKVKGR